MFINSLSNLCQGNETSSHFLRRLYGFSLILNDAKSHDEQKAEISNHCERLRVLLQDGVFSKYIDWLAQWGCH